MSEYKRDHPRIKESLQVEIVAPGGKALFATTYDVSKRGVQLVCDKVTVQEIFGGTGLSLPTQRSAVILKLQLGDSSREPTRIEVECTAIFSRRVSEQEYRVGLQIDSLPAASRNALDSFVDECSSHH